jgi:hypothetical protein
MSDVTIWFVTEDDDDSGVSIHIHNDRVRQWCGANGVCLKDVQFWSNTQAMALHDQLLAAGFDVLGVH